MPQFSKSCQRIAYHSIGFLKSFKFLPMHSTSFHISKVTEQTWRVQNCPTMVHVQAVGSVRLPSEIYETQAAGLPESVGGATVRICSQEQMSKPYEIVDAQDEHEHPKRECYKYLLTKPPADSKQGPTDMSSFRETCTAETQQVHPRPGPKPPTGPPPAAAAKAPAAGTWQQHNRPPGMLPMMPKAAAAPAASYQASSSNTVAPDTLLQQSSPSSTKHCEEPPIKMQKLGREALAAEEVLRSPTTPQARLPATPLGAPVTPLGAPVTPPGLIGGSPSSAEMTCPTTVARVAEVHAAKTAQLYSPENWQDHINFRRSITTHMSICFSVLARRRAFTS
jgi:hypothetical protein